jgi:hypothetical protein
MSIHRELATRHGPGGISYQMVRKYVSRRRSEMRQLPLSPAHQAVADLDLDRLRGLLDAGHDVEDDNGDGWTLLRRAIHAESGQHARTGEPLHADMTAFLLARGADPQATGASTHAEAKRLGHWLASEIIRGRTGHRLAAGNRSPRHNLPGGESLVLCDCRFAERWSQNL